jgi:exopolysaccharide production protein ExoZ
MNRLHGVQYLRAAAALAVVCFHAAEKAGVHFAIGAAGVDMFFVVSGFIMWVVSENRLVSPWRFFRDRLERVVPVYWIASSVMVAGALFGLFPNMRLTVEHALGSFFFIPHRSPSNGEIWPVLVQGWTLNYEMYFYALFAGALFVSRAARLPALAAAFSALVACSVVFQSENPAFQTYTRPIILEFLIGATVGKLWLSGNVPSSKVGVALILAAVCGFGFIGVTHIGFTEWVFGPLAAALLLGVLALEKDGIGRHMRRFAYLGDSSYSIYLWHTMAISLVAKLGNHLPLSPVAILFLAVSGGVAVGIACYEIFEKPIAAILKSRRDRTRRPGMAGMPG